MSKITTAHDYRKAKRDAFSMEHDGGPLHPRIGTLTTGNRVLYYAYLDGYANPETYGTVEYLTAVLVAEESANRV